MDKPNPIDIYDYVHHSILPRYPLNNVQFCFEGCTEISYLIRTVLLCCAFEHLCVGLP